jgi:hypothetical protein
MVKKYAPRGLSVDCRYFAIEMYKQIRPGFGGAATLPCFTELAESQDLQRRTVLSISAAECPLYQKRSKTSEV